MNTQIIRKRYIKYNFETNPIKRFLLLTTSITIHGMRKINKYL